MIGTTEEGKKKRRYLHDCRYVDENVLDRSHTQRRVVTIVTHNTWFARKLATRAAFFHKGNIVGVGTVGEIIQRFQWEITPHEDGT